MMSTASSTTASLTDAKNLKRGLRSQAGRDVVVVSAIRRSTSSARVGAGSNVKVDRPTERTIHLQLAFKRAQMFREARCIEVIMRPHVFAQNIQFVVDL